MALKARTGAWVVPFSAFWRVPPAVLLIVFALGSLSEAADKLTISPVNPRLLKKAV